MKMDDQNDRQIRDILRQGFPPVNTQLARDLWPDVLRKLDTRSVGVPWYDWALVGLSAAVLIAFPRLVLVFAYHL